MTVLQSGQQDRIHSTDCAGTRLWTRQPRLGDKVVDKLSDTKGLDTVLLDMHEVSLLADYFVLSTGEVDRHIQALSDEVTCALKAGKAFCRRTPEGNAGPRWPLLTTGMPERTCCRRRCARRTIGPENSGRMRLLL